MAGGGGDAPPLPASNGGEFLLSLLQKAPHHHYRGRSPPQPQQSPVLDPAVAAVGPTLPFQQPWGSSPSSSNPSSPWPNSQSPPFNFLGFPPNPYSSPPNPNYFPQFPANLADEFRKIGFSTTPNNSIQNFAPNQKQHQEQKLSFLRNPESSVNAVTSSEVVAKLGNGNLHLNASNSSSNEFRRAKNYDEQEPRGGGGGRGKQVHRAMPPPGFGNKPRGGGSWDSGSRREHNVDRERQSSSELARNREGSIEYERVRRMGGEDSRVRGNGGSRIGVSAQLDHPGPPAGANVHSVSASEIEESMMGFVDRERGREERGGVEDVGQQLGEDEKDEKNEGKQHHKVKPFSITIQIMWLKLMSKLK